MIKFGIWISFFEILVKLLQNALSHQMVQHNFVHNLSSLKNLKCFKRFMLHFYFLSPFSPMGKMYRKISWKKILTLVISSMSDYFTLCSRIRKFLALLRNKKIERENGIVLKFNLLYITNFTVCNVPNEIFLAFI